jgi:uncharacterized protein (TIGR02722 family)
MRSTSTTVTWAMAVALLSLVVGGCQANKVSRMGEDESADLTTNWNATDSKKVAKTMIKDMLSFPWVSEFKKNNNGKKPRIIVFDLRNKSHTQVAVDTFIKDIRRAVLRSGKAGFVAAKDLRQDIRDERESQDLHASADTRAAMGQEYGADYALSGTISSIVNQSGNTKVVAYQVDLSLLNIESNEIAWTGQEEIKKKSKRSNWTM